MAKVFDCVDHKKTVENPSIDESTRPPYLPPEKPVYKSGSNRTRHGTMDWFKIDKGVQQSCILSSCLFNLYAESIMRNAGLDEIQAAIKISRRNIKTSDMHMTPPLWQKVKKN